MAGESVTGEPLTKDKIIAIIQTDLWDEGGKFPRGYFKKDVASAVRLLRERINDPETIANYGKTREERLAIIQYVRIFIGNTIKEVFGGCEKENRDLKSYGESSNVPSRYGKNTTGTESEDSPSQEPQNSNGEVEK